VGFQLFALIKYGQLELRLKRDTAVTKLELEGLLINGLEKSATELFMYFNRCPNDLIGLLVQKRYIYYLCFAI
jgi:hypothetical protein